MSHPHMKTHLLGSCFQARCGNIQVRDYKACHGCLSNSSDIHPIHLIHPIYLNRYIIRLIIEIIEFIGQYWPITDISVSAYMYEHNAEKKCLG